MKRHIIILAAVIMSSALSACQISIDESFLSGETVKGDGNIATREYDITQFNELSCALPATVNYTVGDAYSCSVSVDENLFDYIEIKVRDGALLLGKPKTEKRVELKATQFVIDITAPRLEEVNFAGSGDLVFVSPMDEQDLEINLAGAGNVVFKEEANIDNLELHVAGSGDISIPKGVIRELDADIAGSGKIVSHADVRDLDANVAGSGDITAQVNGTLEYFIAGSGDIKYYGDAEVKGKVMGSGTITRIDAPEL